MTLTAFEKGEGFLLFPLPFPPGHIHTHTHTLQFHVHWPLQEGHEATLPRKVRAPVFSEGPGEEEP